MTEGEEPALVKRTGSRKWRPHFDFRSPPNGYNKYINAVQFLLDSFLVGLWKKKKKTEKKKKKKRRRRRSRRRKGAKRSGKC